MGGLGTRAWSLKEVCHNFGHQQISCITYLEPSLAYAVAPLLHMSPTVAHCTCVLGCMPASRLMLESPWAHWEQ